MANSAFFRDVVTGYVFETSLVDSYKNRPGCEKISKVEGLKALKGQARIELLKMLKPGQKVYAQIKHVSASGMSRSVALYVVHEDDLVSITCQAARLLGTSRDKHDGITVGGCGFDACFDVVYRLGLSLWPDGTDAPHGTRNGEPDTDGGYALEVSCF